MPGTFVPYIRSLEVQSGPITLQHSGRHECMALFYHDTSPAELDRLVHFLLRDIRAILGWPPRSVVCLYLSG